MYVTIVCVLLVLLLLLVLVMCASVDLVQRLFVIHVDKYYYIKTLCQQRTHAKDTTAERSERILVLLGGFMKVSCDGWKRARHRRWRVREFNVKTNEN